MTKLKKKSHRYLGMIVSSKGRVADVDNKIKELLGNGVVIFFISMIITCTILSFFTPMLVKNFSYLAPINERSNIQYQGT